MSNVTYENETLFKKIVHYSEFARKIFQYLNGYINPFNPCTLNIATYNLLNFAEYAKPNIVTLYIGSIVESNNDDNTIKQIILITIAHELSHSNQDANMIEYTNNPYYKKYIEDSNEGYTEVWLLNHANEIKEMFDIDLNGIFSKWATTTLQPFAKEYQQANTEDYFINIIMDVIFRNESMYKTIRKYFNDFNSIVFSINDSNAALLKYIGEYNQQAIPMFNRIINAFCRHGFIIGKFKIINKSYIGQIYDDPNGLIMHFIINDISFQPIRFK